jgi:hypothetical protein
MARIRVVLSAVARAANRGSKSLREVSGNNMFYAGLTLAAMTDVQALAFFVIVMALVLFLPSSGDPMTVVPRERLEMWPLTAWERRALRLATPLLNPLTWLLLAGMLWRRVTWGLWAFVAGFFLVGFFGSASLRRTPTVWVPRFLPPLLKKDLRQFLTALDFYCALLIAVPAAYLRFVTGELPADSHAPLTMVIIVMMSTMALTLFGLDGESGLTRYRLLPVSGWRILLSKGLAYLALVLLVTLPLSPVGGVAGGLLALAIGQWYAVRRLTPPPVTGAKRNRPRVLLAQGRIDGAVLCAQSRWRFRASSPFAASLGQMLGALAGFAVVTQLGAVWLPACVVVYAGSLWLCGRRLETNVPALRPTD